MKSDVKVSILCMAYNHEKYIEQAILSFLNQKAQYKIEILIHDDASTDGTTEIIKKYQALYPDKITAILQTENQHSKGVRVLKNILMERATGKYFALCEGDDYWIDENKIEKQVSYMEQHPQCTLCVHNAYKVSKKDKIIGKVETSKTDRKLTTKEVIENGGAYIATNSIVSLIELGKNAPDFFDVFSLDYIWQMYLSSVGYAYCFNDYMSSYRIFVENSWTSQSTANKSFAINQYVKLIEALNAFNDYSGKSFDSSIKKMIGKYNFQILYDRGQYDQLFTKENKEIFKEFPMLIKVSILLKVKLPRVHSFLKSVRNKLK